MKNDSVRFTHEIVDAYLHRRIHKLAPVDITIKPAFTPTLSFLDFDVVFIFVFVFVVVVVVYRDHVTTTRSLRSQSRAQLRFLFVFFTFSPSHDFSRPSVRSFRIPECKRNAHAATEFESRYPPESLIARLKEKNRVLRACHFMVSPSTLLSLPASTVRFKKAKGERSFVQFKYLVFEFCGQHRETFLFLLLSLSLSAAIDKLL